MRRDAYSPNVFRKPSGITESLLYHASLRLPQPNLPGAKGRATRLGLRVSTASAGALMLVRDQNGNARMTVAYDPRLVER